MNWKPQPGMTILTIIDGCLVATKYGVVTANINSLDDFYRVCGASTNVSVSSSVDFPEEHTSRKELIALCHEICNLA